MLAHLELTVLTALNAFILSLCDKVDVQKIPLAPNEASVLESKDVLLQMLEKKLKEIKENKKSKNGNGDILPKNVDFNLKSNGISAVGDTDLLLRYGANGQGTVNMTAEGISNVGRVQLLLGTGDNGLRIPGLSNLFSGSSVRSGDKNMDNQLQLASQNDFGFRRQTNGPSTNNTEDKVNEDAATAVAGNDNKANIDEKAKADTVNGTGTGNPTIAATGGNVPIIPNANPSNASANVVNPNPAIKSDAAAVNGAANNGENLNNIR
ncbi:uncharacterized protein LOC125233679 [Leguminivora glycinivorella]|uniref:uncharacterized protein LOC125233679 n=1 Tax=Leguminivora glycinivorella TaxID=1035111 RepID=UPI00200DA93F|nr:uncharacterized protein LOC125233679 [Leguminivora glycinivorella]